MNINSLLAYKSLNITKSQHQVFDVIAQSENGMTMNQVGNALKRPKNAISGRFGELVGLGYLEIVGHTIENGSRVGVYRVVQKDKEAKRFEQWRLNALEKIKSQYSFTSSEGSLFS